MSCHRCLKVLTLLLIFSLPGKMVLAKGESISNSSEYEGDIEQKEKTEKISRLKLQTGLMRFARMFISEFKVDLLSLERHSASQKTRLAFNRVELNIVSNVLKIATGPDPVANLLDMAVFVTLLQTIVEKNWDAEALGKEKGLLPEFCRKMEKEIWSITDKVLEPRYQKELRERIRRWQVQHPKQLYIERVGLDTISVMLGKSVLVDAEESGFLLPEVNEATRSVDEARNLAERVAFYIQYLPYVLRTNAESGIYDFFAQPETIRLLSDIDQLTSSIEGIRSLVQQLPDRLRDEVESLMKELLKSEEKLRALNNDIQKSLAQGGEMAAAATETAASIKQAALAIDTLVKRIYSRSEPGSFDIKEWFKTVHEANETAKEARALLADTSAFLTNPTVEHRMTEIEAVFDTILLKAFLLAASIIVFFLLSLLVYRVLLRRALRDKPISP